MSDRRIEWDVAEVIDHDYTYSYIPNDKTNLRLIIISA
jgi:hypothetical protein